ncbi:MAG: HAMP domain-containing sensor histidine kinase [Bacteroidota bacterium]
MNLYSKKQRWKLLLIIAAVIIGVSSLWYTNQLVKKLSVEERKKVELWAEATRQLANSEQSTDLTFILKVIIDNKTVPVILADKNDNIISFVNIDSTKAFVYPDSTNQLDTNYLKHQLDIMRSQHEPIEVTIYEDYKQYIYHKNSTLLTQLKYFPYIQLGVISLFILVAYFAFSYSRKAEQNQVWVGMSKETAHQLGTPLSSILAWVEMLKSKGIEETTTNEIEKDIKRLEIITERFSKIGSVPKLKNENLIKVLNESVNYIKSRVSEKVIFTIRLSGKEVSPSDEILAPLNNPLFQWVIENLCKNAVDAVTGAGSIDIDVSDQTQFVYIDINDTGKGLPKSKHKIIFQPGYTTKQRSWGLGLSLSKRIIENYHNGKIFVKRSEPGKGTTFRIVLKK